MFSKGANIGAKVLFAVFLLLIARPVCAETISVTFTAGDTEYAPYVFGEGERFPKDRPGVSVELVMMLESELDIKIDLKRYPYLRNKSYIKNGKIDGMFAWSFKKKRLKTAAFPMVDDKVDTSKRLLISSYAVYKLWDSKVEWDGSSFKNLDKPVGVLDGYSVISILEEKYKVEVDHTGVKFVSANLGKLFFNRVSAVVGVEMACDAVINSRDDFKSRIKKISPPFQTKASYLVLSHQFVKKHPEFAIKIWDAIERIREKHLARLMKEYAQ